MSGELNDNDPFDEPEEQDKKYLISEAMVKKATFLIHKLANQKKRDYKEIQNKCKKLFSYTNLAKVSMDQGHQIINKLIELTGGEEEARLATDDDLTPQQGARATDDGTNPKESKKDEKEGESIVILTMREAVRAAVNITLKEVVEKDVPVQGLGGFVLEIAKVIFEAKQKEEVSK